jgi:hypothetical protein
LNEFSWLFAESEEQIIRNVERDARHSFSVAEQQPSGGSVASQETL